MDSKDVQSFDLAPDANPELVTASNERVMPHHLSIDSLSVDHTSDICCGISKQKQSYPAAEIFRKQSFLRAEEHVSDPIKSCTGQQYVAQGGSHLIPIDSTILKRWDQVGRFENLTSHAQIAAFLVHFYETTKASIDFGGLCAKCSAPLSPVSSACNASYQEKFETSPVGRSSHPKAQFISELCSSAHRLKGGKRLQDHKEMKTAEEPGKKKTEVLLIEAAVKSAEPIKPRKCMIDSVVLPRSISGTSEQDARRQRIIRSLERTRGPRQRNRLKPRCAARDIALVCSMCGEQFKKPDSLIRHFGQQHSGEKKPFKCAHCDTKLSSVISLTVHMRRHTGEKPFVCQICGAAFAQSSHLIGHKLTHSGYKPYKCIECGTAFSSSSHLTVHMRSHSGIRPFLCHECGAAFTASGHLKVHMRKHTGERPFVCNECGAAFSQSGNLREHKKKHEDKVDVPKLPPERNFVCTECGATFIRANHMKVHMRKHRDERPFRCKDCGKSFFESSSLKSHTRIHTGEKPFKCSQCDAAFANSSNLKVHIRKHTGEKPFSCEICGATFTQSNSVHTHMRRKHMNSLV